MGFGDRSTCWADMSLKDAATLYGLNVSAAEMRSDASPTTSRCALTDLKRHRNSSSFWALLQLALTGVLSYPGKIPGHKFDSRYQMGSGSIHHSKDRKPKARGLGAAFCASFVPPVVLTMIQNQRRLWLAYHWPQSALGPVDAKASALKGGNQQSRYRPIRHMIIMHLRALDKLLIGICPGNL